MGLDIGDKRIGVALCDQEEILASPCTIIQNSTNQATIKSILALIYKYNIEKIVVGLPYSMNGTMRTQACKVLAFIEELSDYTDIEIITRDERLSTVASQRLLTEAGHSKKKAIQRSDSAAAAFILQGYIDSLKTIDL